MPEDKTYNGWTNWETWLVNLHFGDSIQNYVQEDRIDDHQAIEEFVQELVDANGSIVGAFLSDAINGFWSEVNWREILRHAKEE